MSAHTCPCSKSFDDIREFWRHIAGCSFVLDGVRVKAADLLASGAGMVTPPKPKAPRRAQADLFPK